MQEITSIEELNGVLDNAGAAPFLLFKHSTVCPISTRAHSQVMAYLEEEDALPLYLVKVIESRPVSNEIADRLAVVHQSPQLILVHEGQAVWKTSHISIKTKAIRKAAGKHVG